MIQLDWLEMEWIVMAPLWFRTLWSHHSWHHLVTGSSENWIGLFRGCFNLEIISLHWVEATKVDKTVTLDFCLSWKIVTLLRMSIILYFLTNEIRHWILFVEGTTFAIEVLLCTLLLRIDWYFDTLLTLFRQTVSNPRCC